MEGEFNNFMMVWFSVLVSLSYCYGVAKLVPIGIPRLFFIFPIVILFFLLPLNLSTIHLGGGTAFFITWLGSFKLLLFIFGKGPLALDPSISLGKFLAIACLPIEIRQNPSPNLHPNGKNREIPPPKPLKRPEKTQLGIKNPSLPNPNQNGKIKENPPQKSGSKLLVYAMKGLLLAVLVHVLGYKEHFHQKVILALNCLLIYILLEILLSTVAFMVRALLGLEIQPHFNDPLLSTSLQDFWGRRWNLMVSRVLRPTVYGPIISFSEIFIGREWAPLPAIMGTFMVSGLMHELIFYYMGRVRPTWEVTWFFVLHGLCLMVEIVVKKKMVLVFPGRWRLPWMISTFLTLGFFMETCYWLFFPQFLRCNADVRIIQEYADFGAFLKDLSHKFTTLVR